MKLCECGCGQPTKISPTTAKKYGYVKGEPFRYLPGHHNKHKQPRTHGLYRTAEYKHWIDAKQRCFNPKVKFYEYWGGRGITMCDEWKNSFEAFFQYVGSKPSPKHTLDRYPNNDGNYEPGNVRWATRKEQQANTRPRRNQIFLTQKEISTK